MENPIIQVIPGQLRGVWEKNIYGVKFAAFRGIPYAKPPVGNLRFKDPEPLESWSGIKDATRFGNISAQENFFLKGIIGDEDCLFLNIYTSDLEPSVKRPVMVWIHGGAFFRGSSNDDFFGPDYLIEKDVVLVTLNYRLGILGTGKAIVKGFLNVDDEEASGNQGLKDQVLALKWVQQNISSFGGDPNNVTIFGESAGGASVHYLTISPLAQGLFHKAIMQSGVAVNPWATPVEDTKITAQKLASILGNEITDSKKLVEFLRTIDVNQLLEAEKSLVTWRNSFMIITLFGPTVDIKSKNPFLPVPIHEAVKAGVRVPCMFGHTSHEGSFFLSEIKDKYSEVDEDQENSLVHPNMKKWLKEMNLSVSDIKKFFIGDENIKPQIAEKLSDLMGATLFIIGIHETLKIQTETPNIPTYLYKFEYESEIPLMQKVFGLDMKGTFHGEDVAFLFYPKISTAIGKKPVVPGSAEYLVIQRFLELWTNFAKTGNPTPQTSQLIPVDWKPIDNSLEYNCLNINENLSMIKQKNLLSQIKKFIEEKP